MGYLGKISALVTANTGDFSRNLNAAASDVRKFASSVQNNITKASTDAERSFKAIYTPLQTLERSLKAAASMKLSFKGFDGAIRDINVLKERLTSVKGTQIDLILKASGLRTISEFREAIKDISNESFNFAIKFGGIDKLKLIREELRGVSSTSVSAVLAAGGLERLKELKETIAGLKGDQLSLALRVGGTETLTKVEQQAVGLSRKDMNLLLKVGGAESLDKIVEELGAVGSRSIDALVNIKGTTELDRVIKMFDKLTPEEIRAVISVVGEQDLAAAETRLRQLYSAAEQVFKPLGEAQEKFAGFSSQIQDAFGPALISVQRAASSMKDDIDSNVTISKQKFESLAVAAGRVVEAVGRIGEATELISAFNPGTSLQFNDPESYAAIKRVTGLQQSAMSTLTPAQMREGQFAFRSSQIADELNELNRLRAAKERIVAEGPGDNLLSRNRYNEQLETANALIAQQVAKVNLLADAWERVLPQPVDRNQDRLGESSPMDRNFADIGAFTSIRGMGERTDISRMNWSSSLADRRVQLARETLGEDVDAPRRQMNLLLSEAAALKGQIAQLPAPMRAELVPAIRAAEQEMLRLAANADTTGDEIERAAANLRNLEASVGRMSAANAFGKAFGNLDEFLSTSKVRQFTGEMTALREVVAGAGDTPARARAVRASNRLAAVRREQIQLDEDERGGVLFPERRAELDRRAARAEAIADRATARAAGLSVSDVRRRRTRGGDVGRMGADSASLALNQLAFAVDDFMSSTGGIEFKLRAISNNLTQMAFVLGGTTGLWIGLGAVFAGQLTVGLLKWINNGKTAEDQIKSLNSALERQKSLASEVADIFRTLGETTLSKAFSEPDAKRREFSRSLEDARERQAISRDLALGSLTPEVQSERAKQNSLNEELQSESDPLRRVELQKQIMESQDRERAALSRAKSAPVSVQELMPMLSASGQNTIKDAQLQAEKGFSVDMNRAMRNAVQADIAWNKELGLPTRNLEAVLLRLEDPVQRAVDTLARDIARASRGPAEQIAAAQAEVAEAIKLGIPGARLFQIQLTKAAEALSSAYGNLEKAARETDKDKRVALVRAAEAQVNEVQAQRTSLAAQGDALRYERIVDPQRQIDARMGRARSNLSAAGLEDGRIARRLREIEAERETIKARQAEFPELFQAPEVQRGLQELESDLNDEAAALEAATIAVKAFAVALNRASEEARGNLNSAQQAADDARRADLGNSTPRTRDARRQAEEDLESQRQVERAAQAEIAVERDRLEQRAQNSPEAARIREIDEMLASGVDNGDRESLIRERESLRAQMDEDARESERRVSGVRDASTAEEEFRKSAMRGSELGRTERDNDREKAAGIGADIAARASQFTDDASRQEFIARATRNAYRDAAPALVAMDEQFNNAMREPSRARLEAVDVSTRQGQSELNRLLRGDDDARNQNLEVLNRQLGKLEEIRQAVVSNTGQVVD